MKLTIKAKLLTTPEQHQSLKLTLKVFNDTCNYISQRAFETKTFNNYNLHYLVYKEARNKFPKLSSQFIVRSIAKVSNSYIAERKRPHKFKKYSAVVYDQRLLSFKRLSIASINSVDGRLKIPFIIGQYNSLEGKSIKGQADLTFENNKFYLNIVIEFPDGTPFAPKGFLGVDMGIANLATTSDGSIFSGKAVDKVRIRITTFKKVLQKKRTKSAKRHLKKLSGKERRFKKHTNHTISKKIVQIAKDTHRAIALENLKGFKVTVRKEQREQFGKWAFDELGRFIAYKAKLAGIPIFFVDPRNTSRTCSKCGHIAKSNRKSQSEFICQKCGFSIHADLNGAKNIALRADVIQPIAVHPAVAIAHSLGTASHLL